VEAPFTFTLGPVAFNGVIDRVHRRPDGSLEVVDYKTDWTVRTPEQVREGMQLQIYLLALKYAFPDLQTAPARAAMYFLRWNKRVELEFSDADLAAAEQRLIAYAEQMKSIPPDLHRASPETCRLCEYRLSCRFSQAAAQELVARSGS
ncbi:MAG: PD-(D/E)XK nuclease family protein, partial [Chloroflexota bacterium]|nr:PD-(D/E)XK nuclease family protein [Chloroflexota bacterium]